ncbi:MAG: hypothetical protein WHS88_08340 [Anaerohalosphaeraceae bacterium]
MIQNKITFILGAGASMAYGFPSGATLKALIWRRLQPSFLRQHPFFYEAAGRYLGRSSQSELEKIVQDFRSSLSISPDETIDYFLEISPKEFQTIGRLAIAWILLEKESKNCLFEEWLFYHGIKSQKHRDNRTWRIKPEDGHWYQFLFNQMCRDCKKLTISPKTISP